MSHHLPDTLHVVTLLMHNTDSLCLPCVYEPSLCIWAISVYMSHLCVYEPSLCIWAISVYMSHLCVYEPSLCIWAISVYMSHLCVYEPSRTKSNQTAICTIFIIPKKQHFFLQKCFHDQFIYLIPKYIIPSQRQKSIACDKKKNNRHHIKVVSNSLKWLVRIMGLSFVVIRMQDGSELLFRELGDTFCGAQDDNDASVAATSPAGES